MPRKGEKAMLKVKPSIKKISNIYVNPLAKIQIKKINKTKSTRFEHLNTCIRTFLFHVNIEEGR